METTYSNIYYFDHICAIGGTETFLYELAKKYKNIDLTIVYKDADPTQLARLKQYVRCIKYTGQKLKCKKIFFNYHFDIIDNVEAKEYIFVAHGDYEALKKTIPTLKPPTHPKITKYIAVSQNAAKSFTKFTGKPCEVCYNPYTYEKPKKQLKLISATRLTKEKGKNRIIALANLLDKEKIDYIWTIYTTDKKAIQNPHIVYKQPVIDISKYIAEADYLVQLSDNEGFCYSVIEALSMGVPVIVTPCPVFKEFNLQDGINSYTVPFDMQNIDVKKFLNIPKNFKFIPPKDSWDKYLDNVPSTYDKEKNATYLVEALPIYQEGKKITDSQLGHVPYIGERWEVNKERLDVLLGNNKTHQVYVKLVDIK